LTAPSEARIAGIGQIALNARDLGRAVRFYRDTLGLHFLFEAPPRMAFFQIGDVRLLIGEPEQGARPASSIIYYRVPDIHAAYQALVGRGVTFLQAPHLVAQLRTADLWLAFFRDSEDNTLALMSEVPR
jgi:methylmalonyl-CoA/ethylmalonyl-CoA epimerase